MDPYYQDAAVTIYNADCREALRELADGSARTCVTSPPYFGLRDYGHDGQIGLEGTPDAYVEKLVDVFREVRRVLADDGTLWLNLGDTYAAQRGGSTPPAETLAGGIGGWTAGGERVNRGRANGYNPTRNAAAIGLKHKDLIGIPWAVAFALRAEGWFLRQDIIWAKPNPMPESVKDRCTKSHEYLFLLSKSERYFFDHEAMREPSINREKSERRYASAFGGHKARAAVGDAGIDTRTRPEGMRDFDGRRTRRSVWTVETCGYRGAHFATFPPKLIQPCVLAGSAPGDMVLDPFGGAGTTALVAKENGRRAVLAELNKDYAKLAAERVAQDVLMLGGG